MLVNLDQIAEMTYNSAIIKLNKNIPFSEKKITDPFGKNYSDKNINLIE